MIQKGQLPAMGMAGQDQIERQDLIVLQHMIGYIFGMMRHQDPDPVFFRKLFAPVPVCPIAQPADPHLVSVHFDEFVLIVKNMHAISPAAKPVFVPNIFFMIAKRIKNRRD